MEDLFIAQRKAAVGSSTVESRTSAVSWAAILAGAVVAAATSLILALLVMGVDLASMSAWAGSGASATSITAMTAIGVLIIQWFSAGIGGYITGRLRAKWVGTHTHEVFFRDTANGFIAWAVATLLVTAGLASGVSAVLGSGAHTSGLAAVTGALSPSSGSRGGSISPYDLDVLFRTPPGTEAKPSMASARDEAAHVLARALVTKDLSAADRTYLTKLLAAQTGVSDADAQRRVDAQITELKAAAESARRTSEMTATFAALALVVGAFIACVSAALGGRERDLHP